MRLTAHSLTLAYDGRPVATDLSLDLPEGQVTVIVGANACGKSTLLRALARLLRPTAGQVVLDGRDIHGVPTRELARSLGLLPQTPLAPEGIVVGDLVARGRHPHQGLLRRWTSQDAAAVAAALDATGTAALVDRPVDELSGGQRQRVWIAMALAQQTSVLLLDEPTTYLDLSHQVDVLDLLTDLNRSRGVTIGMVLHDLNLAARYADHVVALRAGEIVAAGPPSDVVTAELVRDVFGMEAQVIEDPVARTPLVVPVGRHHCKEPA
ncbi:ABC transporter ATP-binding protein [Nocardioides jiangxiensis]|uniref:ABC transporter ATP-binding protein n=1 Tax=Nocardioides jiangxiensis TaxID=3064524 RepID=A0ABT9B280_9ACTN|nr:ABC transporter ATP-binding protein [Nocardioides sp. WY-20]MDO7868424.1 ABC transporter ATP-binding protein [Nocardioides sp. WY-20]